jgi:hypothetical protein
MALMLIVALCTSAGWAQTARWPEQRADSWYAQEPWLVGSNYVPKSAINQLEMWLEATFDPANSGWVQSPGAAALADLNQYPRLKAYVQGVVGAFERQNHPRDGAFAASVRVGARSESRAASHQRHMGRRHFAGRNQPR